MGRPRKTVAELKQSGNYRPSRHKERVAEERPPAGMKPENVAPPVKPKSLKLDASALWDELIALLGGAATERDGPLLRMACEWWAELRLVRAQMRAAQVGDKVYMQALRAASICSKELDRILSRFPLTPKDRANFGAALNSGPPVAKVPVRPKNLL